MSAMSGQEIINQNIQLNLNSTTFEIPAHILDDLCSRFIINIPEEERTDLIRIFFQIELAHWFYLDFYCQVNIDLKACGIKEFSKQIFHHCPTLIQHADEADNILLSWREYKMAVPTYGAIILDPSYENCLLVQGFWARASWGFPKGKVNEDENPRDCAVREVLEETGFDMSDLIDEEEFIEFKMNEQLSRLYIIHPVSMETKFKPQTRKEIKKLEWFNINHLPAHKKDMMTKQHTGLNPNAFFMVIPFIKPLRRWVFRKQNQQGSYDSDANTPGQNNIKPTRANKYREKLSHNEPKPISDKQRQNQQKYFTQQMQSELQEINKFRQPRDRSQIEGGNASRNKSLAPSKQDPYTPPRQQGSSKKNEKQYQILRRDGTVAGLTRRTLEYDENRTSAYVTKGKQNVMKTPAFFSPSLANFRLDIDAVMEAMFPKST